MRPTLLGAYFAARLAIMYKFLCPFLLIILFANGIKVFLLHCTAVVQGATVVIYSPEGYTYP